MDEQKSVSELVAVIDKVRALHTAYHIYDECGHAHSESEPGVLRIEEVGLVCADGHMWDICRACCTTNDGDCYQTDECTSYHDHGPGQPICATAVILDGTDAREDSSDG